MGKKKAKLEALLWEYCNYTKWENVVVFYKDGVVIIVWSKIRTLMEDDNTDTNKYYLDFTMRTFPVEDIDTRIKSFQDKIKYEEEKKNSKIANEVE